MSAFGRMQTWLLTTQSGHSTTSVKWLYGEDVKLTSPTNLSLANF